MFITKLNTFELALNKTKQIGKIFQILLFNNVLKIGFCCVFFRLLTPQF